MFCNWCCLAMQQRADLFISSARFALPASSVLATMAQVKMGPTYEYTCRKFLELQTRTFDIHRAKVLYTVIHTDEIPND